MNVFYSLCQKSETLLIKEHNRKYNLEILWKFQEKPRAKAVAFVSILVTMIYTKSIGVGYCQLIFVFIFNQVPLKKVNLWHCYTHYLFIFLLLFIFLIFFFCLRPMRIWLGTGWKLSWIGQLGPKLSWWGHTVIYAQKRMFRWELFFFCLFFFLNYLSFRLFG